MPSHTSFYTHVISIVYIKGRWPREAELVLMCLWLTCRTSQNIAQMMDLIRQQVEYPGRTKVSPKIAKVVCVYKHKMHTPTMNAMGLNPLLSVSLKSALSAAWTQLLIALAAGKEEVAYTERNNSACQSRAFQNRAQLSASNFFKAREIIYLKQAEHGFPPVFKPLGRHTCPSLELWAQLVCQSLCRTGHQHEGRNRNCFAARKKGPIRSSARWSRAGTGPQAVQLAELEITGVHTGWWQALCHSRGALPTGVHYTALAMSS